MEKAYKLLAIQEKISNGAAKELIDAGLVSAKGAKIVVARAEMKEDTVFKVARLAAPTLIFEDENIIAVNKPAFVTSEKIAADFGAPLLNRLDKETSGVVLLYKNEEFQARAIREFKAGRVGKTYFAAVRGVLAEELTIDQPLTTIKTRSGALTRPDPHGKTAVTHVYPLLVEGKRSLVRVVIETGRTHQIRCHLANAGFGVIGDEKYAKNSAKRMYLHSYETTLLNYRFRAAVPREFSELGFDLPRELAK